MVRAGRLVTLAAMPDDSADELILKMQHLQ
ncbi:MAG: hypothetical protein H6Q89_4469, partial [Myxococcaceae bacterium]|nr:hypothetical protein [Myxococcaceae bacterium]